MGFGPLTWMYFFSWMPLSLQIIFGGFVALAGLVIVIKVIALILDAIPFL